AQQRRHAEAAECFLTLGDLLRREGKLAEALPHLRRAAEVAPQRLDAQGMLGVTLMQLRRPAEAVEPFRRATLLQPGVAVHHYNLANALWASNQTEAAVASYRATLVLDPHYAEAWCNLGQLLLRQHGEFAAALALLRRGHAEGSARKEWGYSSEEWVREA